MFDNNSVCRLSKGGGMWCERMLSTLTGTKIPRSRARLASEQTHSDFTDAASQIPIAA
jgi:hypothetical protein